MRWIERLDEAPTGLAEPLVWVSRGLAADMMADGAAHAARPAELAEAAGLGAERGARRLVRRGLLRALAARVLAVHPDAVKIVRDPGGGLRIVGPEPLYVSHAGRGEWAAVALARTPIGVDIEEAEPAPPLPLDLLHPLERERLAALSDCDRAAAFARLWVVKEAFAKASGRGLDGVLAGSPARWLEAARAEIGGAPAELRTYEGVVAAALTLPDRRARH